MYCVILFLIVNMSLFAESNTYFNDNYNILLKLDNRTYHGSSYEIEHIFVVLRDKPFFVKLLNYTATKMLCQSLHGSYTFPSTFKTRVTPAGIVNSFIEVQPATEDMTGKWECVIGRPDPAIDLTITFKVRVKKSNEKRIKIKINRRDLEPNLTEWSELQYDEVVRYSYWHGEMVDLVCSNGRLDGQIYLRYYDSTGKMLIQTGEIAKINYGENDTIVFQKTLYYTHNNHMIDCTYVTLKDRLEFTTRIIFVLTTAPPTGDFKIVINDIQLTPEAEPATNANMKTRHYRFLCLPEEMLAVTCELLRDGDFKLYILDAKDFKSLTKSYLIDYEGEGSKKIQFKIRSTSDPIRCTAYSVINTIIAQAHIVFEKREYANLRILGLNAKDVVTQYTNTSKDWVIDYVFKAGQVLIITCVANHKTSLRLYESSGMQDWHWNTEAQNISKTFILEDGHHNSKIICLDGKDEANYRKQIIIKLYQNQSVPNTGSSQGTPSIPSDVPGDSSDEAPHDPSPEYGDPTAPPLTDVTDAPSSRPNVLIVGGVAVFALVLTILTTLCTVIIYRRHKRARMQQSDENLIHQSDTPIPTYPPQWDSRPENNGNTEEFMVRNSLYNHSDNIHYESPENLYMDVEHFKKQNNATTNSTDTSNVYHYAAISPKYSNINPISEESSQSKDYDYVYAQVRK